MKHSKKVMVALLGISILFFGGVQAFGQEWSAEQKEVLKMEITYWDYFKEGDIQRYMTLWHKDVIAWPSWSPKPVGKEALEKGTAGKPWFKLSSYDLKPLAINIFDNFAIIYSRVNQVRGENQVSSARIGHFYMKQDGKWQIIGGLLQDCFDYYNLEIQLSCRLLTYIVHQIQYHL